MNRIARFRPSWRHRYNNIRQVWWRQHRLTVLIVVAALLALLVASVLASALDTIANEQEARAAAEGAHKALIEDVQRLASFGAVTATDYTEHTDRLGDLRVRAK